MSARPATEATGRCLCGRTSYAYDEAHVLWRAYCHCESCRRATGAPVAAYLGVADGRWRWTGPEPRAFGTSPAVTRWFCPRCGTPVAYAARRFPGEMHFHVGTLDAPQRFVPEFHVHSAERLRWLEIADDLLRYPGTSPGAVD